MKIKGVANTFFKATKNWRKVKFSIFLHLTLTFTELKVKVSEKNN